MTLRILALRPDLLNVNGDAENARVLAVRAGWAGIDAKVTTVCDGEPSAVVIGSGYDGDLVDVIRAVSEHRELLARCIANNVPILCVAMGLDILGTRIELRPGEWIDGLGLLDGEAALVPNRIHEDIVVESEFGTLVGYENNTRAWSGSPAPLGQVLPVARYRHRLPPRSDGARHGPIIGTHLRGPVLARNPVISDHILRQATHGRYTLPGPGAHHADLLAAASRAKTLTQR